MHVCNVSVTLPRLPKYQKFWFDANIKTVNRARRLWVLQSFGYDFDMLSFTLGIINPYAYRFVISESTHYYMGNKRKPLYLKMNIHKLRQEIQEKIVLLDADEDWEKNCKLFQQKRKWCLEYVQMNQLLNVLLDRSSQYDLALYADTDEIPYPHILQKIIHCSVLSPYDSIDMVRMISTHYLYGFHCVDPGKWNHGPRLISIKFLHSTNFTSEQFYSLRLRESFSVGGFENAGMHLSYFGSIYDIQHKLEVWGHANWYLNPDSKSFDTIQKCVRNCHDIVSKKFKASFCYKTPLRHLQKITSVQLPPGVMKQSIPKKWIT